MNDASNLQEPEFPKLEPIWNHLMVICWVVVIWAIVGFGPWTISRYYRPMDSATLAPGTSEPGTSDTKSFEPGTFGDSFGFVNALFSGLALAGVIVAIFLQRKELFEQRKQLYFQFLEQKQSVDAQQASQKALEAQASYNQVSELLALARHYGESELFDPSRSQDRFSKDRFYKRAAQSITESVSQYLLESATKLTGFKLPDCMRELESILQLRREFCQYGYAAGHKGKQIINLNSCSNLELQTRRLANTAPLCRGWLLDDAQLEAISAAAQNVTELFNSAEQKRGDLDTGAKADLLKKTYDAQLAAFRESNRVIFEALVEYQKLE